MGYYDQHQDSLNPEQSILDEVWNAFPKLEQSRIRGALGLFLFTGDEVFDKISQLSGGERGRVALTKLMLKQDNLLLLDEPAAGMNPAETARPTDLIGWIRENYKVTILLIEHDMSLVMKICERIYVLDYGMIIANGTPAEIQADKRVTDAYLGGDVANA